LFSIVSSGGCVPASLLERSFCPPGFACNSLTTPAKNERQHSLAGRLILSIFFLVAGLTHFVFPHNYILIVPPILPSPGLIVLFSGIAEIAGGLGLLFPLTQRAAAWGLVLLLIAVFPANIYMAVAHLPFSGVLGKSWLQWLRLPLQFPLIYWAWLYTRN
jgi:uncharacterized membrane protein